MGALIQINEQSLNVTGVMADQSEQSSFRMEALIPYGYMENKYAG